MTTKDIYFKTLKFSFIKMGIGFALTVVLGLFLGLFLWIGSLFAEGAGMLVGFIAWAATALGVYKLVMNYFGYMIKAAHVAIISTAVTTGQIPDDMVNVGKEMVKERFATANVYFVIDKLVSGAVSQLQRTVGRIGGFLDFIPGASAVTSIAQTFIGISLGYVDECCLGFTFINRAQNPFKSACDGVCIYFQNVKTLLKNAAIVTAVVIIGTFLAWVLPFAIFGAAFSALEWPMFAAFIIALLMAIVVKKAFVDSYMLVKMMVSYMQVAPTTQLSYDLYAKLCQLSSKFKELFTKATQQQPAYNNNNMYVA